ncbi:MAG TPA: DUF4382 domain-containing protein [Ohtaekwangia sp.]
MKRNVWLMGLLMLGIGLTLSCSDDDGKNAKDGKVSIYITDAPIDDANVDAVVIAINKIEMKGPDGWETVKEFETPFSINILDYQNGESYFVTEAEIEAGTYTEVRLVLEAADEDDESEEIAGSYIRYKDGSKQALFVPSGSTSGYKVKGAFTLPEEGVVAVTLDFDARRSIVKAGNSGKFLLKPTVRLIANQEAAIINGHIAEYDQYAQVVVYAYEKGTYESDEATSEDGEALFPNAVTSAKVDGAGNFKLAFLQPGDYDLIVTSNNSDGSFNEVVDRHDGVTLTAGASINLNISVSLDSGS